MANLRLRTANCPEDYQDSTAKKKGKERLTNPAAPQGGRKTRRTGIGRLPVKLR
jgi:hypothetical protein